MAEAVARSASNGDAPVEELLAILASVGAHACLVAAFDDLRTFDRGPSGAELVTVKGEDGAAYFFGNLPNQKLVASDESLLNLALGVARKPGGHVTQDKVIVAIAYAASNVGGPQFGVPRLGAEHRPSDLPVNYIQTWARKIFGTLNQFQLRQGQWAEAMGYALQYALHKAHKAGLDPTVAAEIVIEYAVPAARFSPVRFA